MLSVILPVHNAAPVLPGAVARLKDALAGTDYELIICEDGSSDGSREAAQKLVSGNVFLLGSPSRLGRGLALSNAIRAAHGSIVIYMDADLAAGLRHIRELTGAVERGADIAAGSRLAPGSAVSGRSALRELFSRGYNLLLRLLFLTSVHDHQCGFKAFRRASVLPLLDEVKDRHWFWDSELLIRAQDRGLAVAELPVEWNDSKNSTVQLPSDIVRMGASALLLRLALWAPA